MPVFRRLKTHEMRGVEKNKQGGVTMPAATTAIRSLARAFTLVEVLLVLALIGLFTGIFVVNFESLLKESESEAVESAFWLATREARTRALVDRVPQALRYDEKGWAFVVDQDSGSNPRRFPISQENWSPDVELEVFFQKRIPPSQYSLIAGELVELREIEHVRFFPDGSCTPFVVAIEVGAVERSIEIDPWTGSELVEVDDA